MDSEQLHYPPGAEQKPAPESPQPEVSVEEKTAPQPEAPEPEDKKPEEEAPKHDEGKEPPPEHSKKRSIYDNYKEKKQEAKEAIARAEQSKSGHLNSKLF